MVTVYVKKLISNKVIVDVTLQEQFLMTSKMTPDHDRIFPTNSDVLIATINRLKGTILTRHFRIDLLETLVVKYSALIERKSLGNNKRTKNEGRQNQTTDKKAFINFTQEK